MIEIQGNIWDYHAKGYYITVTTNGSIRRDGACVMGRGIARQARNKYRYLAKELGECIKLQGNLPCLFPQYKLNHKRRITK